MPVLSGSAVWITPATSPSVIRRTEAPVLRTAAIMSAWRGRSRIERGDRRRLRRPWPWRARRMLSSGGASRSTTSFGIARADRDLVHIDVGRVEQRAAFRHRHGGDRARHVLGAQRRAFERIDRDVDLRPGFRADLLADEQHRRFVALALADHDRAVDRQLVELAPHGVDGGLVGGLLVAVAAQPRRRHRRAFGHAHDLERQDAFEQKLRWNCNRRRHVILRLGRSVHPQAWRHAIRPTALILLDPDDLRATGNHAVALHRRKRAAHGIFRCRIGDQDDRHRRLAAALAGSSPPCAASL